MSYDDYEPYEDDGHGGEDYCRICGGECNGDHDPDEEPIDGVGFADPGGESALRAETHSNPRNLPCPNCHAQNALTPIDVRRGYQCDGCANAAEQGRDRDYVCGGAEAGCPLCAVEEE